MMNITVFSEMLAILFLLGIVVLLILFRLNIFYSSIQFQKTIINQVTPCEAMDQGSKEQEGDGDGPPKVDAKVDTGGQPPGIPLKTPSEGFNESTLRRRRNSSKRNTQSESVGSDIPEQRAKESMDVDVFVDVSENLNSSSQLYPNLNQSQDPLGPSTSQILNVDEVGHVMMVMMILFEHWHCPFFRTLSSHQTVRILPEMTRPW